MQRQVLCRAHAPLSSTKPLQPTNSSGIHTNPYFAALTSVLLEESVVRTASFIFAPRKLLSHCEPLDIHARAFDSRIFKEQYIIKPRNYLPFSCFASPGMIEMTLALLSCGFFIATPPPPFASPIRFVFSCFAQTMLASE